MRRMARLIDYTVWLLFSGQWQPPPQDFRSQDGGLAPSLKRGLITPNCIKLNQSFTKTVLPFFMQMLSMLARKLKPWWWSWTWGGPLVWKFKSGGRGVEPPENLTTMSAFEAFSSNLESRGRAFAGVRGPKNRANANLSQTQAMSSSIAQSNLIKHEQ